MCAWPIAMFFFALRRARPRVAACLLGGATRDHRPRHACSAAAKSKPEKDAGSVRSRRLRARLRTPSGAALQRPAVCAGRGWWSLSSLGLLAAADGLRRALAGACVRLRPLPADGETAAVPDPPVRADLHQPLDRLLPLAAQVALDLEVRVDVRAELGDLLVGQVLDLLVRREAELGCDLARRRLADAVDVGQPDLEPLLVGQVDSGDARQCLALPLLVARVGADDHGRAVPLDHAAALAHGLD